jgi:predicted TIM-barrel fold metal-dependent hydrolase
LIDIHVHLHPERLGAAIRRWFAENSSWKLYHSPEPESVVAELRKHGVERFVFCSYAHKPGIARSINDWLVKTSESIDRFGLPLCTVHLDDPAYLDDAKRALDAGCIGMKIHEDVQSLAVDDSRFFSVYQEIESIGGFVLAHVGPIPWKAEPLSGVERVTRLKKEFPGLNLVIAHLGAPDTTTYLELMSDTPGLYLDTTMGLSNVEGLDFSLDLSLLDKHADRILFGTDFPNIPYEYVLEARKLQDGIKSKSSLLAIMDGTARKLLQRWL